MRMGKYSIKDLEKLSGIKAHTIRIWEKRYGIIEPERTETNYRFYSDDQLRRLLNISLLNNNGYKISHIAKLDEEDINRALVKVTEASSDFQTQIDSLVIAMVDLDRNKFERIFAHNILKLGFEETCLKIIYPLMIKVGVMWQTSDINPAQEHFLSHLIRQKLIVAIDGLYNPDMKENKSFLLFLPEGELHEIGLLFYTYLIKKRGFRAIYLGQSVPYSDLVKVIKTHKPDYLLTSFIAPAAINDIKEYLNALTQDCSGPSVFVAGSICKSIIPECPKKIHYITNASDFRDTLDSLQSSVKIA